jgi:hypothetical protein
MMAYLDVAAFEDVIAEPSDVEVVLRVAVRQAEADVYRAYFIRQMLVERGEDGMLEQVILERAQETLMDAVAQLDLYLDREEEDEENVNPNPIMVEFEPTDFPQLFNDDGARQVLQAQPRRRIPLSRLLL